MVTRAEWNVAGHETFISAAHPSCKGRRDLTRKWIYYQEYGELKEKAASNNRIEKCGTNVL